MNWRKLQLRHARKTRQFLKSQQRYTQTSKQEFIEALKGTGGIKARIADNLGIQRATVTALLRRPEWADVRGAFDEEVESGIDEAELTVKEAISQRFDLNVATRTAMWYLTKVRKERYGDEQRHIHEGGDNPIKSLNLNVDVDISQLDLPPKVKRKILEALDAKQAAAQAAALAAEAQAVQAHQTPAQGRHGAGAGVLAALTAPGLLEEADDGES